jgi:hypothetical protein
MQKTNIIHYALFIAVSLSGACVSHAFTIKPEEMAATIELCQAKFNIDATSPEGPNQCISAIRNKLIRNHREIDRLKADAEETSWAQLSPIYEDTIALSTAIAAFVPSKLNYTSDETTKMLLQDFAKTLNHCNESSTANNLPYCVINGYIDDLKALLNNPKIKEDMQNPDSNRDLPLIIPNLQKVLENFITTLEKQSSHPAYQAFVKSLPELREILKQLEISHAKLVPDEAISSNAK